MTTPLPVRRIQPVFAMFALVLLLSQPGCNEPAPATEPEQRIEAQSKRAVSFKGDLEGVRPPTKAFKAVRRR